MSHSVRNVALLGLSGYTAYKLAEKARTQAYYPQQSYGLKEDGYYPSYNRPQPHRSKIITGLELVAGFFLGRALFRRFNGAAHWKKFADAVKTRTQPHVDRLKQEANRHLN